MAEPTEPEILRAAMRQLPATLGPLLEAYYFDRASFEDIARSTGISVNTVRARLSRGRAALRDLLDRDPRWVALAKAREQELRAEQRDIRPIALARLRRKLSDDDDDDSGGGSSAPATMQAIAPARRPTTKR